MSTNAQFDKVDVTDFFKRLRSRKDDQVSLNTVLYFYVRLRE